jgi:SAM-dependent methyltransferase
MRRACGPIATMANVHAGLTAHSAEHFGDTRDHWWNEDYLRFLAGHWDVARVRTVLDVGCGVGHWSRLLARVLSPDVAFSGVDREVEWVTRATARAGTDGRFTFSVGRAEALAFPSDTFDLVTCQTVLMHLPDPRAALLEMVRVARPGGLVVAAEPTNVVGPLIGDALAAPGLAVDDLAELFRFQVLCQRGKAACGEGNDLLGEQLPWLMRAAGLVDVELRLNDRAQPIVPPYDSPAARALVEETIDTTARDVWMWPRAQTRRYFAAGGGAPDDFDRLWTMLFTERRRVLRALADGRYVSAGAGLSYIAWGRKAAP